jgi:hypothetical protein
MPFPSKPLRAEQRKEEIRAQKQRDHQTDNLFHELDSSRLETVARFRKRPSGGEQNDTHHDKNQVCHEASYAM